MRDQRALELEATWVGLVAAPYRARAVKTFDEAEIVGLSDASIWSAGVR
jgi:hypothetical protein